MELGTAGLIQLPPLVVQDIFLQQGVSQRKGLEVETLDPAFYTTFHVGRWGRTVALLLESFAAADKPLKESVIPENLQSVSGWLQTW